MLKLSKREEERALEIHQKSIVIDSLAPRGGPLIYSPEIIQHLKEGLQIGKSSWALRKEVLEIMMRYLAEHPKFRDEYLGLIRTSGVTATSETITALGEIPHRFENAIKGLSLTTQKLDALPDYMIKATRAEDIKKAKSENKYAVLMNLQNASVIGDDVNNIDLFYRFGVRVLQLTYNLRNLVGTGCTERNDSGVSEFGVKVIERMNQLHMLIDLSHCGYQTSIDGIDLSKDPVAFTHTGCRSVFDHPRSKTDDQLKAIAEKGGYVGIYVLSYFLRRPPERATVEDVMDQIDHAVRLIGADHVGIGTDYEQPYPKTIEQMMIERSRIESLKVGFRPEHHMDPTLHTDGLEDWSMWPNITRGLVSRGYSDQEITNIVGGNFLSILEKVIR
jgi:membrane dipeptidase